MMGGRCVTTTGLMADGVAICPLAARLLNRCSTCTILSSTQDQQPDTRGYGKRRRWASPPFCYPVRHMLVAM